MKYSGIGGQAVMEGVMMRNGNKYAVAVRKPDKEIDISVQETVPVKEIYRNTPIIRGIVSFWDSLTIGMKTLMYSASFFEDEEDIKKKEAMTAEQLKKEEKKEKAIISGTVAVSFVLALGLFFALPYFLSSFLNRVIASHAFVAFVEGLIRIAIFIIYILVISKEEDIKRVFMYHGAEHKCINCIEHGMPLTVENVRKSSRQHKRCGTSFIFIVAIISIFLFMFIRFDNMGLQLVARLLLIPLIAGISYEFLRIAGRSESCMVNALSKPGMWIQNLTTREPDDDMIEVGIASVEAVFDVEKFLEENREFF